MVYKDFETVQEFTKFKEACFFCQEKLKVKLSSFHGNPPRINAPLKNGELSFKLSHVTQEYELEAKGVLDIRTNALVFRTGGDTPSIDNNLALEIFENQRPTIELYCTNSKCKYQYHICTSPLRCISAAKEKPWAVKHPRLWFEGYVEKNIVVHNDHLLGKTMIYVRNNEFADPITIPILDWEAMGKDKLLNRIKTLVTFS